MSVAIEQVQAPFLVTVTFRPEPSSPVNGPHLAPSSAVGSPAAVVPSGWSGLSADELAELSWEDAAWQ